MRKLRLGMPTLVEFDSLGDNVELCRRLGLDFVELNMNLPAFQPEVLAAETIRHAAEQSDIGFTLHLPEELDLASFQKPIRGGHLAVAIEAVAWAGMAGIPLVNMHFGSGVYFTLPEKRVWLYEKHRTVFLDLVEESWARLMAAAASAGVTVCIENQGDFSRAFVREALERLFSLHPRLRLTWDTGHDAGSGYADSAFIQAHAELVGHMHLHDAAARANHLELFTGEADIEKALEFARERGARVVIEVKTAPTLEKSVRRLDERGLR